VAPPSEGDGRAGAPSRTALDYRRQAELCRTMAERAATEDERAAWLNLAYHWDAIASLRDLLGPPANSP
jgi:hypothetical protein